jgi:hypothetical protein
MKTQPFLLQLEEEYTPETRVITGWVFEKCRKDSATEYTFFPCLRDF